MGLEVATPRRRLGRVEMVIAPQDPAHTGEAQSVHRQKYDVDADPENPEVDDPELRVKDPVIEPGMPGVEWPTPKRLQREAGMGLVELGDPCQR